MIRKTVPRVPPQALISSWAPVLIMEPPRLTTSSLPFGRQSLQTQIQEFLDLIIIQKFLVWRGDREGEEHEIPDLSLSSHLTVSNFHI